MDVIKFYVNAKSKKKLIEKINKELNTNLTYESFEGISSKNGIQIFDTIDRVREDILTIDNTYGDYYVFIDCDNIFKFIRDKFPDFVLKHSCTTQENNLKALSYLISFSTKLELEKIYKC